MREPEGAGLEIRGIVAGYAGREVLRDVSLDVRPGEVVGLIGPNGSGKTTLIRVASRGLAPSLGTVRAGGQDPYATSARAAARLVAVVPQDLQPAFSYSVLEVVLMGRSPHQTAFGGGTAEDWARARDAMTAASVHHLADRPIEELSGGERQRVILAQALAQDAPILLLDEPTTHLDLRHVLDTMLTVRALARERNRAVLAVFHDLNLAAAFCDRIVALAAGRLVADGPPHAVVTRELLADVYGVDADVTPAPGTGRPSVSIASGVVAHSPGAPRAHVIGGAGRGAAIMRALAERGSEVTIGVLHGTDTDETVAERLNVSRVSVPAFAQIDAATLGEALVMARQADVVILCDPPFGWGNLPNLRLALAALDAGVPVHLLEETVIEERDFTGGEASSLWRAVASRATVSSSGPELVEVIARAFPGATSRPQPTRPG